MMNLQKLIRHVGTRFIASTSAHLEPVPGRDKSRPYILIPDSFVHFYHCALIVQVGDVAQWIHQRLSLTANSPTC